MLLRTITGSALFALLLAGGLVVWGWTFAHRQGLFSLEEIKLIGVVHTDIDRVQRVLGTPRGTNLLTINLGAIRQRLRSLPWVRDAKVERLLNTGTLAVTLQEKAAVCLSHEGDRLVLIDEYGMPIKPLEKEDPLVLPVVTTAPDDEAPHASMVNIINILRKHTWLEKRISEAVSLSSGRWTLYTNNGIKLLLSNRIDRELDLLRQLQKQYKILDRDVRQVDLRVANKVAVRPLAQSKKSKQANKRR